MKNFITFAKFVLIGAFASFAVAMPAHAAGCDPGVKAGFFQPIPTWYQYLDRSEANGTCELSEVKIPADLYKIALAIIEIVLRFAGLIAFGYVILAGFKFVLSKGNSSETAKARQTIIDAVIGMAITTVASVLVAFIGNTVSKK
jgi:hypothetical protein